VRRQTAAYPRTNEDEYLRRWSDPVFVEITEFAPPIDNSKCKRRRLFPIPDYLRRICAQCGPLLARSFDLLVNPPDAAWSDATIDLTGALNPKALGLLRFELGSTKPEAVGELVPRMLFSSKQSLFDVSNGLFLSAEDGLDQPALLDPANVDACLVRVGDDDSGALLGRFDGDGSFYAAAGVEEKPTSLWSIAVVTPCHAEKAASP
jgi:hypothetical protein